MPDFVRTYDSTSLEYRQAFDVFLAHTDEKAKIKEHLEGIVASLPARRTLIDVGAGNGTLTAWVGERFQKTIAIEPNSSLRQDLIRRCPHAEVLPNRIAEVSLPSTADLVLCSHVLYYISQDEWLLCLKRMTSWLAPQGVLVVILQSRDCDCSQIVSHFQDHCVDLVPFGRILESALPEHFQVKLNQVPAEERASDLASAYTVAEFMLNLSSLKRPVERNQLEDYLRCHFALPGREFRLSLDQDFLIIRRHQGEFA